MSIDQTNKKNEELSAQKVIEVENNDLEDSVTWSNDPGGEAATAGKKMDSANQRRCCCGALKD